MFGEGKCCRGLTENTSGGAGSGGLMTRRRGFLFARRVLPEERERCRWREEESRGRVTAGERRQTAMSDSEKEREE